MSYIITCSTKILTLAIAPFLFISVDVLCKFAMMQCEYILLFPQEEEVLKGQIYTFGSAFFKKKKTFVCHYITMPRLISNWENTNKESNCDAYNQTK